MTADDLLHRVHTNLHNIVSQQVEAVADMETQWSPQELTKRVVRYLYNSAKSPEFLTMRSWEELVAKLVEGAMHGYSAACQEKKWFFEIDLAPAFTSAAWEILKFQARGQNPRQVRFDDLKEFVMNEYEEKLDRILLIKAMWDATSATFPDDKVQAKVYNALHKAYQSALDECIMDSRPRPDLAKVEQFIKRWIDDSMRRAWCSIEGSESIITSETVIRLFRNLIAPFGDQHPFSCVPGTLIDNIGRPPDDWEFVETTVEAMFNQWRAESATPSSSSKRRKTKHAAGAEDESMQPEPDPVQEEPGSHAVAAARRRASGGRVVGNTHIRASAAYSRDSAPPEQADGDGEEAEGHPDCTSQEDCIGRPIDRLVRHRLDGDMGDVYCKSCWESFLVENSTLEGIYEDNGEPYG